MTSLLATSRHKWLGLIAALVLLLVCLVGSVTLGVTNFSWHTVTQAYSQFNGSNEHLIIRNARVPRALIAAVVGASLAVAGAFMQTVTKNPLASPSIFGVNAGAAFLIVLTVGYFETASMTQYTWIAFTGAAVSAAIVYALGSIGKDGLTPLKVTLAGSAITAFFSSMTQGILLTNGKAFDQVLIWLVGSVAGREAAMLFTVLPYIAAALLLAFLLAPQMNVLTMGEDVAKGLGMRTVYVKLGAAVVIVLLAGGSVAVAGPVVFIGIVIPHITRFLVGLDHRWMVPYCAVLGGVLLLAADIGSRFIAMPKEVPVGVMTAIIGVPFFVYIARKGGVTG